MSIKIKRDQSRILTRKFLMRDSNDPSIGSPLFDRGKPGMISIKIAYNSTVPNGQSDELLSHAFDVFYFVVDENINAFVLKRMLIYSNSLY